MAASEAFRMMIRKVIKPEPEDEERERAKKIAMNLLQEAAATVAPFAGDAAALSLGQMFGLAEKQFADTSMIASVMDDIMSTLPVLGDSVRMVTGTEEEGNEKELKDLAKGAWKAIVAITTASGLATAGGIDQAGKAIIEYGFPTTKEEAGKRRAVEVMDDVSENTTREEFDMMLRDEYNEAIDEGYIDKKKTSFKEFRGAMRRRVEKKLGEEKALELGYKKRKKEKGDGEEG
jgi:soluble cytochrome b562